MNRFIVTVLFAGGVLVSSTAFGLAARTFVATTGNDAAPCSLGTPCRSFAAAIAQTATGGEVVVLDSGGYGAVGISKDVSIIAPKGVYGGITAFPTSPNATGITVYNARVVLRGLSINGQGGDFGIWVFGDAIVHIEDCTISNVDQYGVRISGLIGSPEVFIHTTMIHDNGSHGIYATGATRLNVDRTSSQRNGGDGLLAVNGPTVTVTSSVLSANAGNGAVAFADVVQDTVLMVSDSTISRNSGNGVVGVALVTHGNSQVSVHAARNTIASNVLDGISADGPKTGGNPTKLYMVASGNELFDNRRAFHQLNGAVFFRLGNNVVTVNRNGNIGTFNVETGF